MSFSCVCHSDEANSRERRESGYDGDVMMNVTMPTVGWNRQFGDRNISVDLRRTLANSFILDTCKYSNPSVFETYCIGIMTMPTVLSIYCCSHWYFVLLQLINRQSTTFPFTMRLLSPHIWPCPVQTKTLILRWWEPSSASRELPLTTLSTSSLYSPFSCTSHVLFNGLLIAGFDPREDL